MAKQIKFSENCFKTIYFLITTHNSIIGVPPGGLEVNPFLKEW